jgi:hypothetical protein
VLYSEVGAVLLGALHCTFEDLRRVHQFEFVNIGQDVFILEMRALRSSLSILVFDFSVDTGFRLISHPLANKKLVFIVIEITALTLSRVVYPVTFEVITVTLGQDSVAVSLSLMPLTFVDILISVDHAALTLGHSINPVAIVAISIFVEEGTTAMSLIFEPVTSVFSS